MDLYAFEQKTTATTSVGELVFFENNWQLMVTSPIGGKHLLNLTDGSNSSLTKIHDESKDICTGIADSFRWFPNGDVETGIQPSPRHLSIAITNSGPAIAVLIQGHPMFFSTAGNLVSSPRRGVLTLVNWSIHVHSTVDSRSWELARVGPLAEQV
ncbi:hypothetical protein [Xanthomonas phaseoli]|uniref:hypothetical protein n=1 Tax=Xanthomonas phaseoli TaxID=1985254 RepID=UPI0012376AE8|nr:hypothetical protein [Xanthomonas phaseoli]